MSPDQPVPVPGLTGDQAQRWAAVQPGDDARVLVGDSPERDAVVAGLRALAGYLAANPAVPIRPTAGTSPSTRKAPTASNSPKSTWSARSWANARSTRGPLPGITTSSVPSGRSPTDSSAYRNRGWPSITRGSRTQTRWSRMSPRQSQPAWPPPHSPSARRPPPRFPGRPRVAAWRAAAAPRGGWRREAGKHPAGADPGRQRRRGLGRAADRLGPCRRGLAGLARRPHRRSPGRRAHAPVQRTVGHQPGPLAYQPGVARHAHRPGRADRRRAGVRGHHGRDHRVADHRRAHPQARRPGRRARRQPADHAADTGPGREDRHQAPPVAGRV